MKNSRNARFQRGSGCFDCRCCDRKTRTTAVNDGAGDICPQCFELAGYENQISDNGIESLTDGERANIADLLEDVESKGGKMENWADLQHRLTVDAVAPVVVAPSPKVVLPDLQAEREVKWAEYVSVGRRVQRLAQDVAQRLASGRLAGHDGTNLSRATEELNELGAVLEMLDRIIASAR